MQRFRYFFVFSIVLSWFTPLSVNITSHFSKTLCCQWGQDYQSNPFSLSYQRSTQVSLCIAESFVSFTLIKLFFFVVSFIIALSRVLLINWLLLANMLLLKGCRFFQNIITFDQKEIKIIVIFSIFITSSDRNASFENFL